jgi:hypothetical protein
MVSEIEAGGGRAHAIAADVESADGAALLRDYRVADFDNLFAVNVRSPFFLGATTAARSWRGI